MDLSVRIDECRLNVRVAAWIELEDKLLCSAFSDGTISLIGGRVKFGETTTEAIQREILEETGESASVLKLLAIVENFFEDSVTQEVFHEFLFIYKCALRNTAFSGGKDQAEQTLLWLNKRHLAQLKPEILREINNKLDTKEILHLTNRC